MLEGKAAEARAKTLLKNAGVTASDGAVGAMQKLSGAAPKVFKKGHDVSRSRSVLTKRPAAASRPPAPSAARSVVGTAAAAAMRVEGEF